MKALVLNAVGRGFDFENADIAQPVGREVLVDVRASGCVTPTCYSLLTKLSLPAVLGHEVAGIVDAVGPNVRQLHVGDHVDHG